MVIPKQFEGLQDLEAMLLTSILGTFMALSEDLISYQQAESYWLSELTADLFEEMNLSEEIVTILHEGIKLKELMEFGSIYYETIDKLIYDCKALISSYYTEYQQEQSTFSSLLNQKGPTMKKQDVIQYKESIIKQLAELCSFNSVYVPDEGGTPFGIENKKCLEKALEIAAGYGFKTVNVDDYCGYIEMGQGEEIIGILAHLDIVPVSDSWNTDPFTLTLIDDKYYARGTSDDKGAVVCSLAAMRALKPLEHTFTKRVRLILGSNEETGARCVKHYVKKHGHVDYGFTPDGEFPLVFGEKGIISGLLKLQSDKILDIKGGTAGNTVCGSVEITLKDDCFNKDKLDCFFKENKIDYSLKENKLIVNGVAAHASTPQFGVNAISYALEGLYQADINDNAVDSYHNLIGLGYNGEGLKIDFSDDYGNLTFNVGVCYKEDDYLVFTVNIRFPVTMKKEFVIETIKKNSNGLIQNLNGVDPLFYSPDLPMIKALHKAYVDVTNDTVRQPMVIGGGTYAKSMNNVVAFGCDDGKHDYHIHDDNEFVTWDSLETQVACYYHAILNLMAI